MAPPSSRALGHQAGEHCHRNGALRKQAILKPTQAEVSALTRMTFTSSIMDTARSEPIHDGGPRKHRVLDRLGQRLLGRHCRLLSIERSRFVQRTAARVQL